MKLSSALISMLLLTLACDVIAGAPTCHSGSGGYCRYTGKVDRIYINTSNVILVYFDTAVALDVPASVGYTITNGTATAFDLDNNPEFAKIFYSTALAAQATNRDVEIQMKGVESGFLQFDRIWLSAPQ